MRAVVQSEDDVPLLCLLGLSRASLISSKLIASPL